MSETSKKSAKEDEDKKRNHLWWLIPVVLGTAGLTAFKGCEATKSAAPVDDGKDKDKVEVVTPTQTLSQPERDHLRYTIEKGQRMTAKQFGFGDDVDKGAEIYDQFVENIRQGKLPQAMKDLSIKYQMSKMVDDEYGLNLDQPEIAATTWLLMAESYPAIASTIHQAMTNPEIKTTSREDINLNKYLSLANMATQKHNVDGRSNLVSTRDYGLYGATRKTGWAISFRDAKADKKMYDNIAYRALHEGKDY